MLISFLLITSIVAAAAPSEDELKKAALAEFDKITHQASVPLVTFVNFAYRNMTLHFLCNLAAAAPALLQSTLVFMALDDQMHAFLKSIQPKWRFTVLRFPTSETPPTEFSYGQATYWQLRLTRARFLFSLMERKYPFLLFECDALVRRNFAHEMIELVIATRSDGVGIREHPDAATSSEVNAGFMLMTGRPAVRVLWEKVIALYAKSFVGGAPEGGAVESEQTIMSRLLQDRNTDFKMQRLDSQEYVSGRAFSLDAYKPRLRDATVVLFNFAVGLTNKVERAKRNNMWYHDEATDDCIK